MSCKKIHVVTTGTGSAMSHEEIEKGLREGTVVAFDEKSGKFVREVQGVKAKTPRMIVEENLAAAKK